MTMALFVAFVNENVNNGWRQFYFIKVLRAEGLVSKQKFNVVLWGGGGGGSETLCIKQVDKSNITGLKKITKLTF